MSHNDFPNQNIPVPSHGAGSPALQSERLLLVREANPTNSLRDYMSILFKQKTGIIVAFLVLSVIGTFLAYAYAAWYYRPQFEAKSSLIVKFVWENYAPDMSPLQSRVIPVINQGEIVGSEMRILQSREVKEKVIDTLKPETIFPGLAKMPPTGLSKNERALLLFDKSLTVRAGAGSNIIEVLFKGSDPTKLATVANQLVKYYIEKRAEIYKDPKAILFLETKAEEYRQRLVEAENRLKAFRDETKIVSFDQELAILLQKRANLSSTLSTTSDEIREVKEKITELEKELSSMPKEAMTAAAAERAVDADARLLDLQMQEKELLSKYKEDNRLVANIRERMEMVKEYLKKGTTNKKGVALADPVYQEVQKQILNNKAELSALKVRYANMEKGLAEIDAQIHSFETMESRSKDLTRNVSANEEIYRNYQRKIEDARVVGELERSKIASITVLEPAQMPIAPINPPKPFLLLIAGVICLAIAGSFGLAYVRELGKQVMSTAMEVERRLDLPVLVTIPVKN